MRWVRRKVSESRRQRWAREAEAEVRYTEENDPDLRRQPPGGLTPAQCSRRAASAIEPDIDG